LNLKKLDRMEKQIVIFFNGYFKKVDAEVLLQEEFDVDFDGQIMVKFLNTNGVLTAINSMNGYGSNIMHEISFKDAEIYFPQ